MWFHSYNPCTKTEKSWADYDSDSDDSLYQEFFASYGNTSLAKGGESEKTNISEAFRSCKTENRASSAIIPASSSGVPTAAFANTQSLPLETRREFQAQIGWNQSSEEDIFPSVTALTSTSPEEIQVAVEKRPEQNTTDFLAKDCKYSATTEEIPVLTTGNDDSSGYLQFEAQCSQSESVKSIFQSISRLSNNKKLHFETPGNFPCEETQHGAYPQEVSKTSLSLRKTEALLLQLEENNHPIVEAKSENLFALNEASCHETYPSSIFKDTKENIVDSTDKALLRGPEEAGLSFKPFLDFSAEWNQLRDQSSTKIEGSNTNPMVSALFDGYLRVFLYLTVEVHSCNEKVITFLKDILSNVHVGEELISTGREMLNEISIILKEAENSTNVNFIPWEDKIRNLESVSTDLDTKFDKFQANLSLLEKEFNPRAAEMIDLISNLAMIRNEVLKSYYRFYQLNGAHVIFCLYNVQQNTTVSEYEAKSNWHVCIDMDEFKQALDHNMEHLATTSASLGSLTGEIRKYLSNAQKMLPPTGKSHTEYVDTKSKKASNGISTELPESGKGEESNSEYAPGKKFKRKRARNKPKKSKRSKSRR
ncbi:hypothetical protein JCM33374_g6060 [Metschnikowia sp. JCM 33374]|nr:hypothetical protein JCM33374_g6060 [Metschnikowia sp. JCM 33374]